MYEPQHSIRGRALRVARQRGWVGEGAGGMAIPLIVLAVGALLLLGLAFTVTHLFFSLLPTILVGLLAGWAGSRLLGARLTPGWTILAGILGSWVGRVLFDVFLPGHMLTGFFNPIQWAASILGAAIVIAVARVVARPALPGRDRPRFGRI